MSEPNFPAEDQKGSFFLWSMINHFIGPLCPLLIYYAKLCTYICNALVKLDYIQNWILCMCPKLLTHMEGAWSNFSKHFPHKCNFILFNLINQIFAQLHFYTTGVMKIQKYKKMINQSLSRLDYCIGNVMKICWRSDRQVSRFRQILNQPVPRWGNKQKQDRSKQTNKW